MILGRGLARFSVVIVYINVQVKDLTEIIVNTGNTEIFFVE